MRPMIVFSLAMWRVLHFLLFGCADCFTVPKIGGHDIATGRSSTFSHPGDTHEAIAMAMSGLERSRFRNNVPEKERTVVILYHKPPNVITSHKSQDARATVYEDVQSMRGFSPGPSNSTDGAEQPAASPVATTTFEDATGIRSKLHAIGRLDADTTGLLLLTNDGGLVHHVTNPDAATGAVFYKTYEALIMGHHTEESLRPIRDGVDIGKQCVTKPLLRTDHLRILDHPNHKSTVVSITLGEGKNRQVRRMFHAIGSGVMKLSRTRIGDELTLDGLTEGEWRVLTDAEVQRYLQWDPCDIFALQSPPRFQPKKKRRRGKPNDAPERKRRRRRR
mmetsp:Transcript_17023/g.39276  ORF Transcript_17023/g.39276 Transcript_17023/m.39276 type:complete len:333 (-) Transcript_17023:1347-2345(-)